MMDKKQLWNVRVNHQDIILRATHDEVKQLYKEDKIDEYDALWVYTVKKGVLTK